MSYLILSIDGGGIRGVFAARLLDRIRSGVGPFGACDLIAGTSTGGIIALGLAMGLEPLDLEMLYRSHGRRIFRDSILDNVRDLGCLIGAQYSSGPLRAVLESVFGNRRLDSLPTRVLIPAFDLDLDDGRVRRWSPKFFHNFPGEDSDGGEGVIDVAMATCAAPTYFPSHRGFVDGGVVCNNPSMAALAQAIDPATGGQRLDDVWLLSIGTGSNPVFVAGRQHDWGIAQWGKPLVGMMIDGVMGVADYQCRRLLGDRYHRLDAVLPFACGMDEWKKTDHLLAAADAVDISGVVEFVRRGTKQP